MAADPEKIGDSAEDTEEMDEDDGGEDGSNLSAQILGRPDILNALQGKFNQELLHGKMLENLPAPVKRRIKALKNLQLETTKIEAKFYEEVHALECKYHSLYTPLYDKRSYIINGEYEPKDEECVWELDDDDKVDDIAMDIKEKVSLAIQDKEKTESDENVEGIPDFWLTIFKNAGILAEMVQECDEPILKHLTDVRVIFLNDPMGFVLEFHFSQNDYFTDVLLTKEYHMKCDLDKEDPFSFEGPEIYKCTGCVINWKKGKNVTMKTIKKKQKQKTRGTVRTVSKTVQVDSFFNFFNPPRIPENVDAVLDDETQALLTSDFEIGHYIRERIVPRAVLYFTGEALEDEEYEEEEEECENEDETESDDEGEEFAHVEPGSKSNVNPPDGCKPQ